METPLLSFTKCHSIDFTLHAPFRPSTNTLDILCLPFRVSHHVYKIVFENLRFASLYLLSSLSF